MSAFYLAHAHIDALVTAAFRDRELRPYWNSIEYGNVRDETAMGRLLLKENARSIMARYSDEDCEAMAHDALTYRHTQRADDLNRSAVGVLKLCGCYDYQSCETDDYEQTPAAKIINTLRKAAICDLPGYEAAPYCL